MTPIQLDHQPTRRTVVVGGALTLAGAVAVEPSQAQPDTVQPASTGEADTVTGTVTELAPTPENALAGKPLADVIVSNGREVTRTDMSGQFTLPLRAGQTIFVVKPAGFQPQMDPRTKLQIIAYVHDPEGTPASLGFRYGGLPATGSVPKALQFQLERVAEPETFDVLMLTDPQPESTAEIEFIRDDVVAGLIGSKAAFGITCGDLMFDDLSMYHRYNAIIGAIGVPWWNIGGNHDLDYEAPDAIRSRDTWKHVFGATYYAFEHGKALFIMLDNVEYQGAGSTKPDKEHGTYRGFIAQDQLIFVKNLLDATPKDRLLVFCMHIPLRTYLGEKEPGQNTANAADLLKLIGDRPSVSFAGHTHSTEHHYLRQDLGVTGPEPHHHHVLTAVSGSWWSGPRDHRGIACADSYDGSPNGHHVLSIDGTRYTTRFIPAAEPESRQMRISLETQYHQEDREVAFEVPMVELLGSPITRDQVASTRLVVNLFDGGPRSTVVFSIDGGAPLPMTRVSRTDPFIVQVYQRHPLTIKKWVSPQKSSHIWAAPLPRPLADKTFAVTVIARDEYGREHRDGLVLEVV